MEMGLLLVWSQEGALEGVFFAEWHLVVTLLVEDLGHLGSVF